MKKRAFLSNCFFGPKLSLSVVMNYLCIVLLIVSIATFIWELSVHRSLILSIQLEKHFHLFLN